MKILCVDQFANVGGGQRSLLDLLPAFKRRRWEVSLATPGDGPFPEEVRSQGHQTFSVSFGAATGSGYRSGRKPFSQAAAYAFELPRVTGEIHKLIRILSADLVYVNAPRLLPHAALAAIRTRIPLLFHSHNRLHQRSAAFLAGRSLALSKARVIACCDYVAEPLLPYIDRPRLTVIYNGVAAPGAVWQGASRRPRSSRIRNIGVVGRIETEKGQLDLVNAIPHILAAVPDCRFQIVGAPVFSNRAYYQSVVKAAEGLPVQFLDWQKNLSRVFEELDLLVVPSSKAEATTRVILEAYSEGLPVVAFPSGGIPEVVQDNKTGFLASDTTVHALARRILSVLHTEPSRLFMVTAAARDAWQTRFSLPVYQERVCSVVQEFAEAGTLPHDSRPRLAAGAWRA